MSQSDKKQSDMYDLAVAWTWEYDEAFINAIRHAAVSAGVSLLEITEEAIEEVTHDVLDGTCELRWLFDRASDEDDDFRSLAFHVLQDHRSQRSGRMSFINPTDDARRAADKATMHLEFITNGIHVPHTIILPPHVEQPKLDLSQEDLGQLGSPFVIKPANTTGGGTGVEMDARSMKDVIRHRMTYEEDKYLLQRRVQPVYLSEARAWFRIFYAFGDTWLCWWDDHTHVYDDVTPDEERWFQLTELRDAMHTIAKICRLDFFSSEFAQIADGTFVSVDYVNELCDMRPKSSTPDGVPDGCITWVAERMIRHVAKSTPARNDKGLEA